MRCFVLLLTCFMLSGCAALLQPNTPSSKASSKALHAALVQLVEKNRPAKMQALATGADKALAEDARLIMKLHAEARSDKSQIDKQQAEKKLAALLEENQQLKKQLEELSKLQLELNRRRP